MKRVIACAGAFAVGVAGLLGANVTGLTPQEQTKWWTVSGSLRGFYDDNSLNQIDQLALPSWGVEVKPGVSIHVPMERTLVNASYDFTMNYYQARPTSKVDQDHVFNARVNHRFTERYDVNLENAFTYSDAPEVIDPGNPTRRGDSSGFFNRALIDFNARLTPIFGLSSGYKNNLRNYHQTGPLSYSALLDSDEHLLHLDGQWFASQQTTFFAGYQFGVFNYTSDDPIGFNILTGQDVLPDSRDNVSHYFYVGASREFSRKLNGAAKVGVQYTDYYNADETGWSPYADMKLTYTYLPGSSVQSGLTVGRTPVDVGAGIDGTVTFDGLATTVYASVNHRFSYRLGGSLYLNYQHTKYNGGQFDNDLADYVTVDSKLDYKLRENLFLELGYVWYGYRSDLPNRDFTRNRVYLGIRAIY
jgi:hypothetical protein